MTDHFYWIWIIFMMYPIIRIIQRFLRKRKMQNYSKSSEKQLEVQLETNSSETIIAPRRNLTKPETKDMLVLGELNRGVRNFEKLQKITGLKRDKLVSILDDLEKKGLMRVEQKSSLTGTKIELYVTDKGFREYYA